MKRKKTILIIIAAVLVVVAAAAILFANKKPAAQWRTAPVTRGDLTVQVTASGTVNPVTTVQVGTQVSGTVSRLFADFNSHVKKGQVVAELDTTFLYASVVDARASRSKAAAQTVLTKQNCERARALFAKGLVAQADLDQAVSDSASAASTLSSAVAQLDRAIINLRYATITSPITGVVVNRNVDVGQTVAASFNTPTLFTIADDLTKMQVQASIDEADIGQVKTGQIANFTVDAYPSRTFSGTVSQIRLQPTTVQNVVTYTVMVDVDNTDMSLLPGMTANITIDVQKVQNALIVPATALKFMPTGMAGAGAWRKGQAGGAGGRGQRDSTKSSGQRWKPDTSGNRGRVFVLIDGKLKRVPVTTLLSNSGSAAVEGDLQPQQEVVVGSLTGDKAKTPAQAQPFGGAGAGGAPGMGRRF